MRPVGQVVAPIHRQRSINKSNQSQFETKNRECVGPRMPGLGIASPALSRHAAGTAFSPSPRLHGPCRLLSKNTNSGIGRQRYGQMSGNILGKSGRLFVDALLFRTISSACLRFCHVACLHVCMRPSASMGWRCSFTHACDQDGLPARRERRPLVAHGWVDVDNVYGASLDVFSVAALDWRDRRVLDLLGIVFELGRRPLRWIASHRVVCQLLAASAS